MNKVITMASKTRSKPRGRTRIATISILGAFARRRVRIPRPGQRIEQLLVQRARLRIGRWVLPQLPQLRQLPDAELPRLRLRSLVNAGKKPAPAKDVR